jgi:molybdate/tungstate transport system permease protein
VAEQIAAPKQAGEGRRSFGRIAFLLLWFPGGLLLAFILLPLLRMAFAQTWHTLGFVAAIAEVRSAIWLSVQSAGVTAAVAAVLGTPLAYFLARGHAWYVRVIQALVDLPLAVPHTVAGIALLFVFGRRGMIGTLMRPLGLEFWGTEAGIIIAMLFVSVPFMVNSARLGFEGVDPRLQKVARTLGAPPFEVFYRVDLPLAWRGILTGVVLTYARSISEIGSVMVLAYYPMTAPVKIYDLYLQTGLRESSAMAVLLLMVTLSTFLVMRFLVDAGWRSGRP